MSLFEKSVVIIIYLMFLHFHIDVCLLVWMRIMIGKDKAINTSIKSGMCYTQLYIFQKLYL